MIDPEPQTEPVRDERPSGALIRRRLMIGVPVAVLVVTAVALFGFAGRSMADRTGADEPRLPLGSATSGDSEPTRSAGSASSQERRRVPTDSEPQGERNRQPTKREAASVQPVRIKIKSIGVDTSVMRLGLAADDTVEVPPFHRADDVGWYTESPIPGAIGPSVLIGHIDSPEGPAVFYRLSQLDPNERIRIQRSDGRVAVFVVDRVQTFSKRQFPTQEVYGDADEPVLRLITCGGEYDDSAGGYQGNTVAFAELVAIKDPQK